MKSSTPNYRFLMYLSSNFIDVFSWKATIIHHDVVKALDVFKENNKNIPDIKYTKLYNEADMFMKGDTLGPIWCFSFVLFNNKIVTNYSTTAISEINSLKNLSTIFRLSSSQVHSFIQGEEIMVA